MNSSISDLYKTLNILCVEDDLNTLEMYTELFSLIFKEVHFATNGNEALQCFAKEEIDVILTDYMMPECNGLEMSRAIRKIDPSIPIIMVTALENIDMLREAIDLNITSFLKKPFTADSLFGTFDIAVKSVIADRFLMREQEEKLLYSQYQENLTFDKEKKITKNDLQEGEKLLGFDCEVFYKPKDTLSGDSYTIKKINDNEFLLFLVDGMGKGISASVTAMLCSAFVNYAAEKLAKSSEPFSLKEVLQKFFEFIQPNLLENEVVSASFLHLNSTQETIDYALFSMPPILYTRTEDETVHKIKSNNTPLASYNKEFMIDTIALDGIEKILMYSDGLNECVLSKSGDAYTPYLKEDFKKADSMSKFLALHTEKATLQEDDVTFIFLNK